MPDVQVRITTTGAEQAVQSFNQVAQSSQRFASTTQQTVTQARIATQAFNFVLFDMARIARTTGGVAGKEFANNLEGAIVAVSTARGAVAAYRGVLESQELITKSVTRATEIFNAVMTTALGPWGLLAIAITAVTVALAVYLGRQQQANGVTQDAIRLHQSLAHAINMTGIASDEEARRVATGGAIQNRFWAEQAARIAAMNDRIADAKIPAEQLAQALKDAAAAQAAIPAQEERWMDLARAMRGVASGVEDYDEILNKIAAAEQAAIPAQEERWSDLRRQIQGVENTADRAFSEMDDASAKAAQHMGEGFRSSIAGILTVTTQGADLFSQLWVVAINTVIQKMLEAKAVSTFFTSIATGILGFFGLQHGGSLIATRPTPLMVGESGAERVTVSPLAGAPVAGGGGMTVNFNAPQFWDQVTYANFIKKVGRDLTSGPVSRVG